MRKKIIAAAAAALSMAFCLPGHAATLELLNVDPPGVGFNDPTPATPVGGNAGTTVGAQRLIAYRKALELWGRTLKSSVNIVVQGSFAGLTCDATGGVLAQAGTTYIFSDFPGAPLAGHWYHSALADALSGTDLVVAEGGPSGDPDIVANFNGNVGKPDCIAGPGWYYGLDNNAPVGQTDFLDTFMHEVSHGLGFSNFANEASGALISGLPDVYMANTFDLFYGQPWNTTVFGPQTSLFLRLSAVNNGNVVWTGPQVTANSVKILGPYQGVRLTGNLNQELVIGSASFGAAATADNFGGPIVVALDDAVNGLSTTDGCGPLTNAAEVAGKIAFMDRGSCGFAVKAKNAQLAGAKGVIIGNNQAGGAIGLGGSDPTVTVPTISVSQADGTAIKAASPGVSVEFFTDPSRRAGTNQGLVRLYAPTTVALGSSISHFDTVALPNLLMEPFINADLRSARNLDLTPALMQDIGWTLETLKIGACDTAVPNALTNGDLLHVKVENCKVGARNHGQFVSCINQVTNPLVAAGLMTGSQKGAISSCAGRSK
ncbi:MAG: serine protease [Betaproteobacteria bacterium]|nr:serine protease [Betaproteobacteria bacterium]